MIANRVELLLEIIFSDDANSEQIFDTLIPKYHTELYVLYNLLDSTDLLYCCNISLPSFPLEDDKLKLNINLDKKERKSVIEYIKKNEETLCKPFKHVDAVKIVAEKSSNGLSILFK